MPVTTELRIGQLDTLVADGRGRLLHFFFPPGGKGSGDWVGEVLVDGLVPMARVEGPVDYLGSVHFVAPAADGGQVHVWWDGHGWAHDRQAAPGAPRSAA